MLGHNWEVCEGMLNGFKIVLEGHVEGGIEGNVKGDLQGNVEGRPMQKQHLPITSCKTHIEK
jgi:hypothetical protein